jgi:predicted CoA-binding protein
MNVAVVGASNKPDRYSYKAVMLLREKGHTPYPVHPHIQEIEGIPVHPSLLAVPAAIDAISVYLSPQNQRSIEADMLKSGARRVIFNPGAENQDLAERLAQAGIAVENACTLVLLKTGQF